LDICPARGPRVASYATGQLPAVQARVRASRRRRGRVTAAAAAGDAHSAAATSHNTPGRPAADVPDRPSDVQLPPKHSSPQADNTGVVI